VNPEDVPEGPLLIDTDVFSWVTWRRGPYRDFDRLIEGHTPAVSFATVGELRAGALKADYGERKRAHLEELIAQHYVVLAATDPVTWKFAELYARFGGRLKGGGVNDMWTAACALAQPDPPPIVTGNLADFGTIASNFPLQIVNPQRDAL
jgi:predicted nucleic acid-binding protein